MSALITGGAGFGGSHLAEALLREGAEVAVADDLSAGRIDNIEHLKRLKNFSYTIDTLLNRPHLAEHLPDRRTGRTGPRSSLRGARSSPP
jgi:nucleoside-diphosphate-sugar epimerase